MYGGERYLFEMLNADMLEYIGSYVPYATATIDVRQATSFPSHVVIRVSDPWVAELVWNAVGRAPGLYTTITSEVLAQRRVAGCKCHPMTRSQKERVVRDVEDSIRTHTPCSNVTVDGNLLVLEYEMSAWLRLHLAGNEPASSRFVRLGGRQTCDSASMCRANK